MHTWLSKVQTEAMKPEPEDLQILVQIIERVLVEFQLGKKKVANYAKSTRTDRRWKSQCEVSRVAHLEQERVC